MRSQPSASPAESADTALSGDHAADDLLARAEFLLNLLEHQITRSDTKAGLVLAADTVFASSILLMSRGVALPLFERSAPLMARLHGGLLILIVASLLVSALYALAAVRPAMQKRRASHRLFFFHDISALAREEFVEHYSGQTSEHFRDSLLAEAHTTACIAMRKLTRVRRSIDCLLLALLPWTLLQIVIAFTP